MEIVNAYSELILENQQKVVIKHIVDLLNKSYAPTVGISREMGEYHQQPVIQNVIDEEPIKPANVVDYIKSKFKDLRDEFIEQVVRDWYDGKFKNGQYELSKIEAM